MVFHNARRVDSYQMLRERSDDAPEAKVYRLAARTHDEPVKDDHGAGHGDELLGGSPWVDVGPVQVVGHERADSDLLS